MPTKWNSSCMFCRRWERREVESDIQEIVVVFPTCTLCLFVLSFLFASFLLAQSCAYSEYFIRTSVNESSPFAICSKGAQIHCRAYGTSKKKNMNRVLPQQNILHPFFIPYSKRYRSMEVILNRFSIQSLQTAEIYFSKNTIYLTSFRF